MTRLIVLITALIIAVGCGKKSSETSAATAGKDKPVATQAAKKPEKSASAAGAPASGPEAAAAPKAASATADEIMGKRRLRRRAVIGGCAEACDSPAKTIGLLFDALSAPANGPDPDKTRDGKLRGLFEWSLLEVDGSKKGDRWASMWAQLDKRTARDAEIDAWVHDWGIWVDRIAEEDGLVAARMNGVRVEKLPGRDDVVAVVLRHPRLRDDHTEQSWRLLVTRRGYEWLISRVDHMPSRRPLGDVPHGTSAPSRL